MFYIFCNCAIFLSVFGILFSISSDINKIKKKKYKYLNKLSNYMGIGFLVCMLVTSFCFFAGF